MGRRTRRRKKERRQRQLALVAQAKEKSSVDLLKRIKEKEVEKADAKTKADAKAAAKASLEAMRWGFTHELPPEGPWLGKFPRPVMQIPRKDGMYIREENDIGVFIKKKHISSVKGLPAGDISEGFYLKLPKLPKSLFAQIVTFFRIICTEMNGAEAYAVIYYDKTKKEYFIDVPEHGVSGGAVHYLRDESKEIDPNLVTAMEIHSHNTMSAFFSATDTADEKAFRLYGVVGHVDKNVPAWSFRVRSPAAGEYYALNLWDIFDVTKEELEEFIKSNRDCFPLVEGPYDEWKAQVSKVSEFDGKFKAHGGGTSSSSAGFQSSSGTSRYSGRTGSYNGSGASGSSGRYGTSYSGAGYDRKARYPGDYGRGSTSYNITHAENLDGRFERLCTVFGDEFIAGWIRYGLSPAEKQRVRAAGENPDMFQQYINDKFPDHSTDAMYMWLFGTKEDFLLYIDEICSVLEEDELQLMVGRIAQNGHSELLNRALDMIAEDPEAFDDVEVEDDEDLDPEMEQILAEIMTANAQPEVVPASSDGDDDDDDENIFAGVMGI